LNTLALEKRTEDRWRRLNAPAAARHLANEIDAEAVAALEAAVVASYPRLSHRYYALKAKALDRRRLRHWDRGAPLSSARPRIHGWRMATATVVEGFETLSPRLADIAKRIVEAPFVDAAPRPGKQAGAFCHPGAGRHPYVFLNFRGERRDVLTLAHEVGHAVHQTLASPQGPLLADIPLTLAETAAMVAESLASERLEAASPRRERRALLATRIEEALATVTRQIAFHRFETRFHEARAGGELSAAQIGVIWLEAMGESLGPAVRLDGGYETYWALVGHFAHAPFYAYAYAFGALLAEAMLERRRADPEGFAPLYEDFLAAGGTRTYVEALAPFGLDARDPALWSAGCARLERLVDEFETLA
ncbi:MAG: M3 family metallopeptidase, partial [Caulobacteraceae bacterium]